MVQLQQDRQDWRLTAVGAACWCLRQLSSALRRPPAEMHRRDHYVLSRHLPASSALFAASLRQVAAISPALPLANRAAAAATVVVNQQATGSRQKKKAKQDVKKSLIQQLPLQLQSCNVFKLC